MKNSRFHYLVPVIISICCSICSCDKEELQYTLTIVNSPSNGGSVTKSPNQEEYIAETDVSLKANPSTGFQFSRWEGDLTGMSNPAVITMNGNKNVRAIYSVATVQYSLTVSNSPANGGTVSREPDLEFYQPGASVKLTANPASGFKFTRWEDDASGTSGQTTVTMTGNKSVKAVYSEVTSQYTLTIVNSPSNGGSVSKSPNQNLYNSGSTVSLAANPSSGFQFSHWEGDVTGSSNPVAVTMNKNKSVKAVYTEVSPLIQLSTTSLNFTATSGGSDPASKTVSISNAGGGTLSGLSRSFPDGTPLWLFASVNSVTAPATLTVSVSMSNPFGSDFGPGTYTSRIAISSTNAGNSPQYVDITFTILAPSSITAFASYDNGMLKSDLGTSYQNTVYSNSEIGVGVDYFWLISGGYNYAIAASAIKFDIQSQISGRNIASATLRLYAYALRGEFSFTPKIRVSAFSNNWNPSTLTYSIWENNMYIQNTGQVTMYAPNSSALPLDFDVTTIVKNWASGTWSNYGFSLSPENHYYPNNYSYQTTYFQSLEKYYDINKRPQIIIEFQ